MQLMSSYRQTADGQTGVYRALKLNGVYLRGLEVGLWGFHTPTYKSVDKYFVTKCYFIIVTSHNIAGGTFTV